MSTLHERAHSLGVLTSYRDGMGKTVDVADATLERVCDALVAHAPQMQPPIVEPVVVAWDGVMPPIPIGGEMEVSPTFTLEDGSVQSFAWENRTVSVSESLPFGYHTLDLATAEGNARCTIISAPQQTYQREWDGQRWGVAAQLAALRSSRSRSIGDLRDLEIFGDWLARQGGHVAAILPILPTFNDEPAEPSPYAPVSRLFWSELILDLGERHEAVGVVERLDVTRAAAEVREALAGQMIGPASLDEPRLLDYAKFRAAQRRYGRNWRDWPDAARGGALAEADYDREDVQFELVAQQRAGEQLQHVCRALEARGVQLGLDLAVGVHPDGYDTWRWQELFVPGMSVGAPPDAGFPSGQDWGFPPVHPGASRAEGHAYLRASLAHQMAVADVLRIDHIMAWERLYWIPHGMGLHQGTYVEYPAEELFAVLTLESHRHHCEVIGENLGTVSERIATALPTHGIRGMTVALYAASGPGEVEEPTPESVAMLTTHDTPTFAGWWAGDDIAERVEHGLLPPADEQAAREERIATVERLAAHLGVDVLDPGAMFRAVWQWLRASESPLVLTWLEDFWGERTGVNLPGTSSAARANWQRVMVRLVEELPEV